ncbi:hypothetical protein COBT_001282 [Conglomerata obtusa]
MFSNPLCKMSNQIHQKKEIMKPNDEVSIQDLHKDDYVDKIYKKRFITKLNDKLLTIKKKHKTDLNKMIAVKITNRNSDMLKIITMDRVFTANNLKKKAKKKTKNSLYYFVKKCLKDLLQCLEFNR